MYKATIEGVGRCIESAIIEEIDGPGVPLYVFSLNVRGAGQYRFRKEFKSERAATKAAEKWIDSDAKGASLVLSGFRMMDEWGKGERPMGDKMALKDAGIREQEWAQELISKGRFPQGITLKDLLSHAVYDAVRDEIHMTVKAVNFRFKVNRP